MGTGSGTWGTDSDESYSLAKFVMQMKLIHPYINQTHKSWYGDKVWSGIPIYMINEYDGHVLCHHVNGACLGNSPVYTWFYDFIMTKFHAPLYRDNATEYGYKIFTLIAKTNEELERKFELFYLITSSYYLLHFSYG